MLEPRGHAEMYGALPVPAAPPAAFGVLFMHHSGFSTMCGHATIALGRWAVASGRVPLHDGTADFILECPCGPVAVHVTGSGANVAFDSVPAFAAALDTEVEVPDLGRIVCDIGYGGAFYAILPASRVGLDLGASPVGQLRAAALAIMGGDPRARRGPPSDRTGSLLPLQRRPDRRRTACLTTPLPPFLCLRRRPDRPQRHGQRRHSAYGGRCRARPDHARRNPCIRRCLRRAVPR